MTDERSSPPPWKGGPYSERIESLLLWGRDAEAAGLIKTAAAEAVATGCNPKAISQFRSFSSGSNSWSAS